MEVGAPMKDQGVSATSELYSSLGSVFPDLKYRNPQNGRDRQVPETKLEDRSRGFGVGGSGQKRPTEHHDLFVDGKKLPGGKMLRYHELGVGQQKDPHEEGVLPGATACWTQEKTTGEPFLLFSLQGFC